MFKGLQAWLGALRCRRRSQAGSCRGKRLQWFAHLERYTLVTPEPHSNLAAGKERRPALLRGSCSDQGRRGFSQRKGRSVGSQVASFSPWQVTTSSPGKMRVSVKQRPGTGAMGLLNSLTPGLLRFFSGGSKKRPRSFSQNSGGACGFEWEKWPKLKASFPAFLLLSPQSHGFGFKKKKLGGEISIFILHACLGGERTVWETTTSKGGWVPDRGRRESKARLQATLGKG